MNVKEVSRQKMLEILVNHVNLGSQNIVFKDGATSVCTIAFTGFDLIDDAGEKAIYRFKTADIEAPYDLIGTAVAPGGDVDNFVIDGDPGTGVEDTITGTIGSPLSSADIKINFTNWVDGTVVTLRNLQLVIPQGS